ncbi:flavodoxin domain-containing protein [Blastococcus sp. SYSU D01042]
MAESSRRVLVAYATASGSTGEIAERIGDRLRVVADVEVQPVGADLDLDRFDAFVIGSAVHDMAWLPDAREFAGRLAGTLHGRPVWLFSVAGIDPRGRVRRWMARQEVVRVARGLPRELRPEDHPLFGGVVHMDGVPLWGRLFYALARQRPGDHRDWAGIEAWADQVAATLVSPVRDAGAR